jgi:hypothetical protein
MFFSIIIINKFDFFDTLEKAMYVIHNIDQIHIFFFNVFQKSNIFIIVTEKSTTLFEFELIT